MAKLTMTGVTPDDLESMLSRIDADLRRKAITDAIKQENKYLLTEVRQQMRSQGLKGGKRDDRRSLVTAMGSKRKSVDGGAVGYVGARLNKPWRAFHAHLYESGHRMIVSRGSRKGSAPLQGTRVVAGKRPFITAETRTRRTRESIVQRVMSEWAAKASQ